MRVEFTVMGEPKGKGRPRFARATGRTYTPQETVNYENLVKVEYQSQCGQTYFREQPLRVIVTAYYTIPKSASKKQITAMMTRIKRPTRKPDVDNLLKILFDPLNGIAYKDDAQVVEATVYKYYDERPRVEVVIEEVT